MVVQQFSYTPLYQKNQQHADIGLISVSAYLGLKYQYPTGSETVDPGGTAELQFLVRADAVAPAKLVKYPL